MPATEAMVQTRNVMGEAQLYRMIRGTIDQRIATDKLTNPAGLRVLGEYLTGRAWELERMGS